MTTGRTPLKELVINWRQAEFGGQVPSHDRQERVRGFLNLFEYLLSEGYEAFEIFMPSNQGIIVGMSSNPHHRIKSKAENWVRLVEEDLLAAKGMHPAFGAKKELPKFDMNKATYKPSEPKPFVKSESVAVAQAEPEASPDVEQTPNQAGEPAPVVEREFKEISPEEWAKVPEIKPEYDEDLRKLLGFDDEQQ